MGCLCPRNLQYTSPARVHFKPHLQPAAVSQQNFVPDSERNRIVQPNLQKENISRLQMLSRMNYEHLPQRIFDSKENTEVRTGFGLVRSGILVSQIGGSKLQRTVSILSTPAGIDFLAESSNYSEPMAQDMVVVTSEFPAKHRLKRIKKRYYSVIQNKLYVKKDHRNAIRIKSPISQVDLFCNYQTIRETLHLTEGIPIENIKVAATDPLSYLVQDNFPFSMNLLLQCTRCRSKKFKTSSRCKLTLDMNCRCQSVQFMITSIGTEPFNYPIWHEDRKISISEIPFIPQGELRTIGCNICWRFEGCKLMSCGCLRCSNCQWEHPGAKCVLCL